MPIICTILYLHLVLIYQSSKVIMWIVVPAAALGLIPLPLHAIIPHGLPPRHYRG